MLKKLPADGDIGDRVLVNDELFVWDDGIYESVRRGRVQEAMNQTPAPTKLSDEELQKLIP